MKNDMRKGITALSSELGFSSPFGGGGGCTNMFGEFLGLQGMPLLLVPILV